MENVESEKSLRSLTELVKEQNLKHEEEILQVKLQKKENSEENKQLISVLNSIFKVLSEQLAFQKSVELQKEIAGELVPKDYQEQPTLVENQSYSKESESGEGGLGGGLFGAYGVFSLFKDALKGLVTVLKDIGVKLMDFLGIGKLLESFKTGLGGIIGKTGEFLRALSPAITRFTALAGIIYTVLQGLEKFGEWFRSITGLPSIQNDAFNMKNYTGENPQYNRPMTPEEFEQNRIPKTVGGESARREGSPLEQPMTQETFQKEMVTRGSKVGASKGRDKLMAQTFDAFVNAGFSENQAKSLVAEVGREGSFNPENVFGYHVDPQNKAVNVGMFSWQKSRGKDLEKALSEKGLIKDGKIERSQETLNEMAKFAKKEMETNSGFSRTKKQFLENPNIGSEEAAEVLGKNYIKWRYEDPRYASGHANRKYFLKEIERIQKNPQKSEKDSNKTVSRATTDGIVAPKMVESSELRVKGGTKGQAFSGGGTEEGTINLARVIQAQEEDLPGGLNRFSSFNDEYHKKANPKSKHTKGLALDFSLKDSKYSNEASDYVKRKLIDSGLSEEDFKIINEYKNPSKHATGGHIHVNFSNKEAAEKYAQYTRESNENIQTYAKVDEKQIPEGGKYKEEESEMEETNEPVLKEKVSGQNSTLVEETPNLDKEIDSGYKGFFEDMVDHLEKMVSFTQDIKETNKEMAKAETTAKKESTPTKSEEKETAIKEEYAPNDQAIKETSLYADKETALSNFGTNPINNISQPISATGTTFGGFGQNPFGTIQNVLGGIGSAVSVGQQMANVGKYGMGGGRTFGGIGTTQGAIGGIQAVLGQMGQQSPMLGGFGQVLGSVGSVMNSVENVKNMGKYGGVVGGINAASGAVGTAGNIFNSVGGMFGSSGSAPSTYGDISASTKKVGQTLGSTPYVSGIGDSISNFFGGMFGSSGSAPSTYGDISASTKKVGQALGSTPYISGVGIGSDSAAINSKYSMIEDSTKRGFSLENMTRSVETTKEENMIPPEPSAPVNIQQGGGGGGGSSGGSADNPPSGGVMGMDIGVRNEEPTLLRAQYGSVRIV